MAEITGEYKDIQVGNLNFRYPVGYYYPALYAANEWAFYIQYKMPMTEGLHQELSKLKMPFPTRIIPTERVEVHDTIPEPTWYAPGIGPDGRKIRSLSPVDPFLGQQITQATQLPPPVPTRRIELNTFVPIVPLTTFHHRSNIPRPVKRKLSFPSSDPIPITRVPLMISQSTQTIPQIPGPTMSSQATQTLAFSPIMSSQAIQTSPITEPAPLLTSCSIQTTPIPCPISTTPTPLPEMDTQSPVPFVSSCSIQTTPIPYPISTTPTPLPEMVTHSPVPIENEIKSA